jgi:NAD(P)-dependent dehydrogenase (short-subunit alcohol dehydrogenase family)
MEELRFDGRVAVVTGAGRGIGRAHAHALASRGASVVVNDVGTAVDGRGQDDRVASAVVREIVEAGGTALADESDISSPAAADRLIRTALDQFGRIDVVVNNAGILVWGGLQDVDGDVFQRHLAVHVHGTFNVTRAAWPTFERQAYGRLVNTTSTALFGHPELVAYGAAKAGVVGLSRALAVAGARSNITVNVVSPLAHSRMSGRLEGHRPDLAAEGVLDPSRVSSLVVFLAHESCPVSGEVYLAGGGTVARIFIGETTGFRKGDLTPEDVSENWEAINEIADFLVPPDTLSASGVVTAPSAEGSSVPSG